MWYGVILKIKMKDAFWQYRYRVLKFMGIVVMGDVNVRLMTLPRISPDAPTRVFFPACASQSALSGCQSPANRLFSAVLAPTHVLRMKDQVREFSLSIYIIDRQISSSNDLFHGEMAELVMAPG